MRTIKQFISKTNKVYFYFKDTNLCKQFYRNAEEEGITFEVPDANKIIVSGIDKQRVGEVSAIIRSKRLPEPYHGKGIKYSTEHIRRKSGKAGK